LCDRCASSRTAYSIVTHIKEVQVLVLALTNAVNYELEVWATNAGTLEVQNLDQGETSLKNNGQFLTTLIAQPVWMGSHSRAEVKVNNTFIEAEHLKNG
jgi:hypothetical protein